MGGKLACVCVCVGGITWGSTVSEQVSVAQCGTDEDGWLMCVWGPVHVTSSLLRTIADSGGAGVGLRGA